ncbi:MAG: hypothetical protein KGI79_02925 [Patescibacteria group bacterium]|nr:hypothetical protein [Patescibacteria group bacterium]MDE2116802.1 hypothetical protein [Patescibacteria group bacterium]
MISSTEIWRHNGIAVDAENFKLGNERLPARFFKRRVDDVRQAATRFAPLLRIRPEVIAVDWDFYARLAPENQEDANMVLWALGILTAERNGNLYIVDDDDLPFLVLPNSAALVYGPTAFGYYLCFHTTRLADAHAYHERIDAIHRSKLGAAVLSKRTIVAQYQPEPLIRLEDPLVHLGIGVA